jgi:hypothetical protein
MVVGAVAASVGGEVEFVVRDADATVVVVLVEVAVVVLGLDVLVVVVVVAADVTMIVPCMKLWTRQWYVYVPAALSATENDVPGWMHPLVWLGLHDGLESNVPLSAVTLCGAASLFEKVTVVPAETVSELGW